MAAGGSSAPVRTGRVNVRGADLMVEVVGAYGPAFMWCHSLLSSRVEEDKDGLFDWRIVADQRWRWVRYDSRGHGESSGTTNVAAYAWKESARDLLALADVLGIARFAGGGASTGCATLLEAAIAAPDRIDRLVLVTPPAAWENRGPQIERYQQHAAYLRSHGPNEWLQSVRMAGRPPILAAEPGFPPFTPSVPPEWLPAALRGAAASDLPPPEQVAQLSQPTLVLAWDTDEEHPVTTAHRLTELMPRADLYIARTVRQIRDWPRLVAGFLGMGVT